MTPATDPNLFVAALFDDGRYLAGGVHNDSSCDVLSLPDQDAGGNGAEFGQLAAVEGGLHGAVATSSVTIDTNGECGLHDAGSSEQPQFMFARSAIDDSLLFFASDDEHGMVLKRVPSVENDVIGAWLLDGTEADHPHLGVFLPDGLMFEISAAAGSEAGLWRSDYAVNEARDLFTMSSFGENCIDTMGFDSCIEPLEEALTLELDGDVMRLSADGDSYEYTKFTTP